MAYLRAAIVTIFFLACILVGYMVFTFDSQHELNVALESFLKGDDEASALVLKKLEKDLPNAQYNLYQAYIARDQKQLDTSNAFLKKGEEAGFNKALNPNILLEIHLNQAFNSYLSHDSEGIANAVNQAAEMAGNNDEWVRFFNGILDYSNGNYSKALENWVNVSEKKPLSGWMTKAFNQTFTPFWFNMRMARSEIEEGKYLKVRQDLEKELPMASEDQKNEINFLLGLSYVKEAQDKPLNAASPYYKLAFAYFKLVPMQNELFVEEKNKIANRIQRDLFTLIDNHSFQDISFYVSILEDWEAASQLDQVSKRLVALLDQEISADNSKLVQELIIILNRVLKSEGLRTNLEDRFQALLQNSLDTGDFTHLEQYTQAALLFSANPDRLSSKMTDAAKNRILTLIPLDDTTLTQTLPYFMFWQRMASSAQMRYMFAKELVALADQIWVDHQEQKAINLMKVALTLALPADQQSIVALIEDQINHHYATILLQDNTEKLPFILEAVQQLKLTGVNIQDRQEMERQLEEAKTLYANKYYPEAIIKAAWVLRIEPKNQIAMQTIGLINYQDGEYAQALPYLKSCQVLDREGREALAVCEILAGQAESGRALLDEMVTQYPISRDAYLKLGHQALINQNPQEGVEWLSKIVPQDNEALAGLVFAEYLLKHWDKVIEGFNQLAIPYNKFWGLQGAAVNSYVSLNQIKQAEELLNILSATPQEPLEKEFSPSFNQFKKKVLDRVDPIYIAADFYKNIKRDYPKALRYFNQIASPTSATLLEKAETHLALHQKMEALKTLEKFLEQTQEDPQTIPLKQKALPQLGTLYLTHTLYPEAAKTFSQYFSIEPSDMSQRPMYAKALMHMHRYDLALEQYRMLEKMDKLTSDHLISLAECLIHTNQLEQANLLSKTLLSYNPPLSIFERLKIGYLMANSRNTELLEMALRNIPDSNQLSVQNSQELIRIKSSMGDYDKALKVAKGHKEELMKTASGLMTLARLEANLSRMTEALQFARQAAQLNPNDTAIEEFTGRYERSDDYFKESLQALKKKMEENPNSITWPIAYARNLIDYTIESQGLSNTPELQQALNMLNKIALQYQEIPEVFFLLGQVHLLLDNNSAAIDSYRHALKLDTSYVDAYKYLALVLQDDPDQAIALLKEALKFAPDDVESWQQIALLYESQDQIIDAIHAWKQATEYRPKDSASFIQIAQLYLQTNQPEETKKAAEKVIAFEPSNIHALKLLLMALYEPALRYQDSNLIPLSIKQQNTYKALRELAPAEADSLLSELSTKNKP